MTRQIVGVVVVGLMAASVEAGDRCPEVEVAGRLSWTGRSIEGLTLAFERYEAARVAPGATAAAPARLVPARIDAEGGYTARLPGRSSYLTRVTSARGAAFPPQRVDITSCSPGRHDLRLEGLEMAGRVIDGADRGGVAGALVRVRWSAADRFEVRSADDGAFALVLPLGQQRVCASPPPGSMLLKTCTDLEIDLARGAVELTLPRAASLAGRVVSSVPGPPAMVWARPLAWTSGWGPGLMTSAGRRAGRDGSFQLQGLRPEAHSLFASAGTRFGWLAQALPDREPVVIDLRDGGEAELEVSDPAEKPESVTAQILRVDGQVVEGALDPLPRRPGDRRSLFRFAVPAGKVGLALLSASSQGEVELSVEAGKASHGKVVLDRPRSVPD
jgi:hypothetical protein